MVTATGEGVIRIYASDPSETVKTMLWEGRTEAARSAAAGTLNYDTRYMVQINPHGMSLPQDYKLFWEMKGDAATTVDATGTTIRVPVRIKTLATGAIRDADLGATDFGMSATDVTVNTTFTRISTQYTISAGEVLKFGKQNTDNSQLLFYLTYT